MWFIIHRMMSWHNRDGWACTKSWLISSESNTASSFPRNSTCLILSCGIMMFVYRIQALWWNRNIISIHFNWDECRFSIWIQSKHLSVILQPIEYRQRHVGAGTIKQRQVNVLNFVCRAGFPVARLSRFSLPAHSFMDLFFQFWV